MEASKLNVFIASSAESLPVLRVIEECLSKNPALSIKSWTMLDEENDPGTHFIDGLIDVSSSVDAAVVVFGPDDIVVSRKEEKNAPRDNVLFELGLFMGNLGPDRALIVGPNEWETNLKIMSDIGSLVRIRYPKPKTAGEPLSETLKKACERLDAKLQKLSPRSIFRGAANVGLLTRDLIESFGDVPPGSVRTLRNIALDMDQTWSLLHDNLLDNDSIENIRVEVVMIDSRSPSIQAMNSESVSVAIAAARETSIIRWCGKNAQRLADRKVEFACKAYADVPMMHGFLVNRKKLMISLCNVDVASGELIGAPNPYLAFEYPAHELRDQTAIYLFKTFNAWFDYRFANGRPVWPVA